MERRPLGSSDLRLSLVGLGCNNFGARIDYAASERVVSRALDAGINHFDTANIYGDGASESFLGKALGSRRADIVLATKFGLPMQGEAARPRGSQAYVRASVDASLKRLGSDWIDLLYMHMPDPETPIEETLRVVDGLRQSGKVRYFGASNFEAPQVKNAAATAVRMDVGGFVCCQDEVSLLRPKAEGALALEMRDLGLGLIPFRPLAAGALSGKYRRGAPLPPGSWLSEDKLRAKRFLGRNWGRIEALRTFAQARGHTLVELAMSWLAQRPLVVSIVAGATSAEQVTVNVGSIGWKLSDAEIAEVDRIATRGWRQLLNAVRCRDGSIRSA